MRTQQIAPHLKKRTAPATRCVTQTDIRAVITRLYRLRLTRSINILTLTDDVSRTVGYDQVYPFEDARLAITHLLKNRLPAQIDLHHVDTLIEEKELSSILIRIYALTPAPHLNITQLSDTAARAIGFNEDYTFDTAQSSIRLLLPLTSPTELTKPLIDARATEITDARARALDHMSLGPMFAAALLEIEDKNPEPLIQGLTVCPISGQPREGLPETQTITYTCGEFLSIEGADQLTSRADSRVPYLLTCPTCASLKRHNPGRLTLASLMKFDDTSQRQLMDTAGFAWGDTDNLTIIGNRHHYIVTEIEYTVFIAPERWAQLKALPTLDQTWDAALQWLGHAGFPHQLLTKITDHIRVTPAFKQDALSLFLPIHTSIQQDDMPPIIVAVNHFLTATLPKVTPLIHNTLDQPSGLGILQSRLRQIASTPRDLKKLLHHTPHWLKTYLTTSENRASLRILLSQAASSPRQSHELLCHAPDWLHTCLTHPSNSVILIALLSQVISSPYASSQLLCFAPTWLTTYITHPSHTTILPALLSQVASSLAASYVILRYTADWIKPYLTDSSHTKTLTNLLSSLTSSPSKSSYLLRQTPLWLKDHLVSANGQLPLQAWLTSTDANLTQLRQLHIPAWLQAHLQTIPGQKTLHASLTTPPHGCFTKDALTWLVLHSPTCIKHPYLTSANGKPLLQAFLTMVATDPARLKQCLSSDVPDWMKAHLTSPDGQPLLQHFLRQVNIFSPGQSLAILTHTSEWIQTHLPDHG